MVNTTECTTGFDPVRYPPPSLKPLFPHPCRYSDLPSSREWLANNPRLPAGEAEAGEDLEGGPRVWGDSMARESCGELALLHLAQ